ncbi:hypothetical protein I553_7697 [Mycobacterium xenopi 4042]|uniref:Uncharacterized protein n=1 Tax=Mycobacterium xenopi 4042 TaxID=1299334 RepID=X8AN40_MYCXE|nr:hypothetical protein I553_7697 [Mycobacterium xenopi 4042]
MTTTITPDPEAIRPELDHHADRGLSRPTCIKPACRCASG